MTDNRFLNERCLIGCPDPTYAHRLPSGKDVPPSSEQGERPPR